MTVGNANSAPLQDYKITAQADEEIKTLRERIKEEIEEKEKADAAQKAMTPKVNGEQSERAQNRLKDRVEISAEGRAKAEEEKLSKEEASAQTAADALDEGDKKPEPEEDKKKKDDVRKAAADDSQWQAEIAKIKQKRAQLLQQIGSAGDDEDKRKKLEAQLAMTEAELAAKDTDAYRKSRTTVRDLGSEMAGAADAEKLS